MGEFVKQALTALGMVYKNLEGAPAEGFMYVKGDYIRPPHVSFLDIEQSKQEKKEKKRLEEEHKKRQ